jgi:hypothetical protein
MKTADNSFVNPIDKDKTVANPGLVEYAHHIGSALIKPEDRGKIKSKALTAMIQQTELQYQKLSEQAQLINRQVNEIKRRVEISTLIYNTSLRFEPLVSHEYYLYKTNKGETVLSMISPSEWGNNSPFAETIAKVKLMADYTWEVLEGEVEL